MANFKGHVCTAAAIGGIAAGLGYYTSHLDRDVAIACWGLVIVGGVTPDVDCDYSHSIRIVFNVLAGAILVLSTSYGYPVHGILGALGFRYLLIWGFRRLTWHRGIWHSVPMGLACGAAVYALAHWLGEPAAMYYGQFFFLGFIVHLLIDEFFSIDFSSMSLKNSSGTAFKFWAKYGSWRYFLLYLFTVITIAYINREVLYDYATR